MTAARDEKSQAGIVFFFCWVSAGVESLQADHKAETREGG